MRKKNIVITGGEGFVGSSLAIALAPENNVISIDNGLNSFKRSRLTNVKYFKTDASNIAKVMKNLDVDIVFHLGEYSRVEPSFSKIDLILENNFRQFYNVCKFCCDRDAKLIYSASSTIFSDITEHFEPSPYQVFKKHNVQFLKDFAKFKGMTYAIAYFYNVYGPGEVNSGEFATVVGKFLNHYRNNEVLKITSPGAQRRNFTHIDDIVAGLQLLAAKGDGDGFGIGSDDSYSIIELASMISDEVCFMPEKKGNRLSASLNTEKMKKLGWMPKKKLKDFIASEKAK